MAKALTVVALSDLGIDFHLAHGEAQVSAFYLKLAQDVWVDLTYPMNKMAVAGNQLKQWFHLTCIRLKEL